MAALQLLLGLTVLALAQSQDYPDLDCKYGQLPGRWVDAAGRSDGKQVCAICYAQMASSAGLHSCCSGAHRAPP